MNKTKKIALVVVSFVAIFILGIMASGIENPYQSKESCNELRTQDEKVLINYIVATIAEQAATCQPVPISYQNRTYNLVLIDCLNIEGQ